MKVTRSVVFCPMYIFVVMHCKYILACSEALEMFCPVGGWFVAPVSF